MIDSAPAMRYVSLVCGNSRPRCRRREDGQQSPKPLQKGAFRHWPSPLLVASLLHRRGALFYRGFFLPIPQTDRDAWKRSREVVTSPANRRPYSDGDAPGERPSTPWGKGGRLAPPRAQRRAQGLGIPDTQAAHRQSTLLVLRGHTVPYGLDRRAQPETLPAGRVQPWVAGLHDVPADSPPPRDRAGLTGERT